MLSPVRVDRGAAVTPPASIAELVARILAAGIAAGVLFVLLVGAFGPASMQRSIAEDGPSCIIKWTTGIDCPLCGMTRATLAMGGGDFHRAFGLHPLAPFVLAGSLFLMAIVALGRTRSLLVGRRPLILLGTLAAIWIIRLAV
jgi:hypothetical protein